MKTPLSIVLCMMVAMFPVMAVTPSKGGVKKPASGSVAPQYREESPLPEGWPEPGPFNQVVRKKYPAYRAAFTRNGNTNSGFRRLFLHISRKSIPMTAPVEMVLDDDAAGNLAMEEMAFLYRSPEVGESGGDGEFVEVRDMPAREAFSYAWQGVRDKNSTARARRALDAELAKRDLKATRYRLLGYNSPFVPSSKQTHELQVFFK